METSVGTDEIALWGTAAEARSTEDTNKEPVFSHHFKPTFSYMFVCYMQYQSRSEISRGKKQQGY